MGWRINRRRRKKIIRVNSQARQLGSGKPVSDPDPIVLLYTRCKEFNCLPDSGGYLDQDPEILFYFNQIQSTIADEEVKQSKDRQRKAAAKARRGKKRR